MPSWIEGSGIVDADARQQAVLVHTILAAALMLDLLSLILTLAVSSNTTPILVGHLAAAATAAGGMLAIRRGHVQSTAHAVVGMLLTLLVGFGFLYGGLTGVSPFVAIAVVVIAYYLLGVQVGVAATGALLVAGLAMAVASPVLPASEPATGWINLPGFLVSLGLISITLYGAISRSEQYAHEARTALSNLQRTEAHTMHVLTTMREGVLGVGPDRSVTSANPAALRLLGRPEGEILGHSLDEVLMGAGAGAIPTLTGTERMEIQIRRRPDAPPTPVQFSMSFGARGDVVCVLADITEMKEAQIAQQRAMRSAEQASRAKSQFLANMSHELRTPLNAILGYSEMLSEELREPGLLDDVDRIHRAGRHLLGLINDILDLSKIEAGRMELVRERVDLAALVAEVAETTRPLAAASGTTLVLDVPLDLGTAVTDAQRLRQILLNLASNACKFTRDGTVTLAVVRRETGGRDEVRFSVSDTGIGISDDQMERLFQPFSQADASTSREFGGTGLGLVLSKRFAEMLGGEIDAVSAEGKGSTFTVRIPANTQSSQPPARIEALVERLPTVVCIDDDPAVLELLSRMLAGAGFQAVVAESGEEGLLLAKKHKPVAITLDIRLPGIDGWEVLATLKLDPELASIPVVIATVVDEERRGYVMGAADYLVKPIPRERLVDALAAVARKPGRALVVEDDEDTRAVLVRRLVDAGWSVEQASDGSQAMAWLESSDSLPDVILLDMMMPVMDGFEVAERLRTTPRLSKIPVVVLTALDLSAADRARLGTAVERAFTKSQVDLRDVIAEVQRLASR